MSCRCAKRNTIMMTIGAGNPGGATEKRRAAAKLLRLTRGTSRRAATLEKVRSFAPRKSRPGKAYKKRTSSRNPGATVFHPGLEVVDFATGKQGVVLEVEHGGKHVYVEFDDGERAEVKTSTLALTGRTYRNRKAKRNCLPCMVAPILGGVAGGVAAAVATNRLAKKNGRGIRSYLVPLAKVKKTPAVLKAIKRHTAFHGKPPTRFRVYEYPDGKSGVNEHLLFKLGAADITIDTIEGADGRTMKLPKKLNVGAVYRTDPRKSPNKKDGQYYHSFRESGGKPPIQAVDVQTGVLHTLGGTYSIGEWMER